MLDKDRKTFYSYDSSWEHTFFDERTGGFLVTQLARKDSIHFNTTPRHINARVRTVRAARSVTRP